MGSNPTRGKLEIAQLAERGTVRSNVVIPRSLVRFRLSRMHAPIVQWLEYVVANDVAGVRFPVGAMVHDRLAERSKAPV